jgi:hypothetical protein
LSRSLLLAGILTGALGMIPAQTPTVERVDVTERGIYTAVPVRAAQPSAEGVSHTVVDSIKLAAQTHEIPLQKGVSFGFRYVIVGAPSGAPVSLRKVVIYPPPGAHKPGSSAPLTTTGWNDIRPVGSEGFVLYSLDDDWEVIPGEWTLEVWVSGRKLASQTFHLKP